MADEIDGDARIGEAPGPNILAVDPPAGLVGVNQVFLPQQFEQLGHYRIEQLAAPRQMAQRAGPAQRNAPPLRKQVAAFAERDAQMPAAVNVQQPGPRTHVAARQFQIAAAFAFAAAILALEFVSPVAMIFRLRFGNIDHHVVLELARRLQSLAAAAGALRQLHVVLLHLFGRDLVQRRRCAKRAGMLAMSLRAAVLSLGFGRRLAIGLRLVSLAAQPFHLGFQLRHPR